MFRRIRSRTVQLYLRTKITDYNTMKWQHLVKVFRARNPLGASWLIFTIGSVDWPQACFSQFIFAVPSGRQPGPPAPRSRTGCGICLPAKGLSRAHARLRCWRSGPSSASRERTAQIFRNTWVVCWKVSSAARWWCGLLGSGGCSPPHFARVGFVFVFGVVLFHPFFFFSVLVLSLSACLVQSFVQLGC